MSYLDADPTKPTNEILNDVRAAAGQSHMPGLPLLPFATLLVRLSQEASVTADKNLLNTKTHDYHHSHRVSHFCFSACPCVLSVPSEHL